MEPLDYQVLIWEQPDAAVVAYLESGIDVNAPDRSGDYLLTVACERLRVDLVKTLLTANADPNVRNAEGNTPTLCAVDCVAHGPEKAYAIVKALVSAGASLEIRGYMDKTPFLKACCRNDLGMIELLVLTCPPPAIPA